MGFAAEGGDRGLCRRGTRGFMRGGQGGRGSLQKERTGVLADRRGRRGTVGPGSLQTRGTSVPTDLPFSGQPPAVPPAHRGCPPPPAQRGAAQSPHHHHPQHGRRQGPPAAPRWALSPAGGRRANRLWQHGPLGRQTAHARPRPAPCRVRLEFASCPDALKRKRLASSSQPCRGHVPSPGTPTLGQLSPRAAGATLIIFIFVFLPPLAPALNSSFSGAGRCRQAPAAAAARQGTPGTSTAEGPRQRRRCGQPRPGGSTAAPWGPFRRAARCANPVMCTGAQEGTGRHRGTWMDGRTDGWTGRSAHHPTGVGRAEARDPQVGATVPPGPAWRAGQRRAAVPSGSTHSMGTTRSLLPCAQHPTTPPLQLCSPHWVLPIRASTHHPTSPQTLLSPGTPTHTHEATHRAYPSVSLQRVGRAAGGLGTCQGCGQRGHPARPSPTRPTTLSESWRDPQRDTSIPRPGRTGWTGRADPSRLGTNGSGMPVGGGNGNSRLE